MVAIFEKPKHNAFSFRHPPLDEITKEIKRLDVKKSCQNTVIATKVIKNSSDILSDFFFLDLDYCITLPVFPSYLKNVNIIPVHKKE